MEEELILSAAKHVKTAISQKQLAAKKIEKAKLSLSDDVPFKDCVVTLVMDFCQSLELPHVGGKQ
eukprot:6056410-Ditylum_brightwellii.AAC.1